VGRVAWTLGIAAAVTWLEFRVPLPSVAWRELDPSRRARLGLFALGLEPALSAFVVVEMLALFVPGWTALRVGGPGERARLTRVALGVTLVLGVLQASM